MKRKATPAEPFQPHVPGIEYGILEGLLGFAVRRAQLVLYDDFMRALAPWQITPPRFSALVIISENPGLKLTELAKILAVARSGAVVLVDALSELGYVLRRDSVSDRRAFQLALTAKGRRALQAISREVQAHDRRISSMLSKQEQVQLRAMLRRMAGVSGRAAARASGE